MIKEAPAAVPAAATPPPGAEPLPSPARMPLSDVLAALPLATALVEECGGDLTLRYASGPWQALTGTGEAADPTPLDGGLYAPGQRPLQEAIRRALADGAPTEDELRLADGRRLRLAALPLRVAGGHTCLCWLEDVTGQRLETEALHQSETQLRSIVGVVQEGIQLWDRQGRQVYANPASIVLFGPTGGPGGEHCYHSDGRLFRADELPVARILATGRPVANLVMKTAAEDGQFRWIRVNGQPLLAADGEGLEGAVTSATDITELVENEHRLMHLAHYDALTQLPNRVLLGDRMRLTLAHSQRAGEMVAVCLLDLDGFKPVNDTYGHKAGDQLLREVASRLRDNLRAGDTAARLGGDEFALLLGGLRQVGECDQAMSRLLATLGAPYRIGGHEVHVSASVGVTLFPNDGSDPDRLLRHADQAMYAAKQAGKNRYHLFDPSHDQRARANAGALRRIDRALAEGQFTLLYQPQVDCRRGQVTGVEALVRWQHPILGLLSPGEFLPLIEQDDLIVNLGEWVIGQALQQIEAWQTQGIELQVSVNVSARQLHQGGFAARLLALAAGLPPQVVGRLELEIVETAALEDVNAVGDAIAACHALGVRVALDDFGTGFSSLVHLKRLAADILKIDQAFVGDMLSDPEDLAIVEGVVGLAAAFKRRVVAEGVETIDHILMLLELGCDVMQGFGLARPMAADKIPEWLRGFRPDPLWNLSASPRPSRDYFELLLAEANHRHWVDMVVGSLRQPGAAPPADDLADHRRCRFGQWYYNEGSRRFRSLREFVAVEPIHQAIHHQAEQLRGAYLAGELEAVAAGRDALLSLHQELVNLLRQLRYRLAEEMLRKTG